MVVRQGLELTVAGLVVGVAAAIAFTRVMVTLVFGVSRWDPMVFALVAGLLGGVALIATYVPARRATRVNPVDALRG